MIDESILVIVLLLMLAGGVFIGFIWGYTTGERHGKNLRSPQQGS